MLHKLVGEKALRGAAIRGLAAYDDPKTPDVILAVFADAHRRRRSATP